LVSFSAVIHGVTPMDHLLNKNHAHIPLESLKSKLKTYLHVFAKAYDQ